MVADTTVKVTGVTIASVADETEDAGESGQIGGRGLAPLYFAGFTSAVGAHGIAAVLGAATDDIGLTLFGLGLALAVYDLAEVVLKPIFGALSDRIGPKPVILGGLIAFIAASLIAVISPTPLLVLVARLGQGAAASAFSPASSAAVARLARRARLGRSFGRYGSWKSLGYVVGPLLGIGLASQFGLRAVFAALAVLAAGVAVWAAVAVPKLPVLPKTRPTLRDLVREIGDRGFLVPTLLLAASTGILGAAVGFLPLLATRWGLPPMLGAVAVAAVALASVLTQPRIGARADAGLLDLRRGGSAGLVTAALALLAIALAPSAVTLLLAAAGIGIAIGIITPLAFAHLAANTPEERMGRTMGNAELGRELGDAGGPLFVGAAAGLWGLPIALSGLAGVAVLIGGVTRWSLGRKAP